MKQLCLLIGIILTIFSCSYPDKQGMSNTPPQQQKAPLSADEQIIPGKSIGYFRIRQNTDSVLAILGKPDSSDAAMGKVFMVWKNLPNDKGYSLAIYAQRNMGATDENISRVKKIITTSPRFKTPEGLAVGTTFSDIKKHYNLKTAGVYSNQKNEITIFDDDAKGIAFDIDNLNDKCVAITVHQPAEGVNSYLNVHVTN